MDDSLAWMYITLESTGPTLCEKGKWEASERGREGSPTSSSEGCYEDSSSLSSHKNCLVHLLVRRTRVGLKC